MTWKWLRGDYRVARHGHGPASDVDPGAATATCAAASGRITATSTCARRVRRSAIGLLHGLAGTGAVVLVLIAALPTQLEAAAALAVFAPMSIVSMAGLTGASPGC